MIETLRDLLLIFAFLLLVAYAIASIASGTISIYEFDATVRGKVAVGLLFCFFFSALACLAHKDDWSKP